MTERSHGAPDPAGRAHSGTGPEPADPAPDPAELSRTDALLDALAAGRPVEQDAGDPAVHLLRALVADTSAAPALRLLKGGGDDPGPSGGARRRRGPRTIVALGVVGAVLATTGVAAAGSGLVATDAASPRPAAEDRHPTPVVVTHPAGGAPERTVARPSAPEPRRGPARASRQRRPERPDDPVDESIRELRKRLDGLLPTRRPARPRPPAVPPRFKIPRPPSAQSLPGATAQAAEPAVEGAEGTAGEETGTERRIAEIERRAHGYLDRYGP
ncbi:hypothetical protein [Actinomadura parmotrematis]|uniref:Uncharacterized protein n=1 Tax=Actinomadura parmotrematis TaxID=2864039 RepID=A0ABS7G714_9ACTN|nr:hypothetical protein [Actinomadura parmotrematis]MBW8487418.1 hypothetical protein [Actinomadura parmotrematis]